LRLVDLPISYIVTKGNFAKNFERNTKNTQVTAD